MITITEDNAKITYIPRDQVETPRGNYVQVLRDRWWITHPERGVVLYGTSPQCNDNEMITRKLAERMYPWATVEFFPLVLMPIDPRDY